MTSVPGSDLPEADSEAHISLVGRAVSLSSRVESAEGDVIVVRPSVGEYGDQSVVSVDTPLEVSWVDKEGRRALPTEVVSVDHGVVVRWRLRVTGPVQHVQRRSAVRGRVGIPVTVGFGAVELTGETLDLSEGGVRASVEPFGTAPGPGAPLDVILHLDAEISTQGELVRYQEARNGNWVMSIRFLHLKEKDEDRSRRRVFEALREERAKDAG